VSPDFAIDNEDGMKDYEGEVRAGEAGEVMLYDLRV
jgi:hypothetical protein